uniref:Thymidylate kinase-like domain-containing protein n=1 Tax=Strigamia maritima TaxID=126957 RepID=T1IQG9_STRMM
MLSEAIFKLNSCVHRTTGHSPFYLVYGFHPPIDKELTIGRIFEDTSLLQKEYNLQIARNEAISSIYKKETENKARHDATCSEPKYTIGEKVWYKNNTAGKFKKWKGPFIITCKKEINCYSLGEETQKGVKFIRDAYTRQLKPFTPNITGYINEVKRGALIAIEGCDKTGKTSQIQEIIPILNKTFTVVSFNFPDRTTDIGQLIDKYLKETDVEQHAIRHLFSANR